MLQVVQQQYRSNTVLQCSALPPTLLCAVNGCAASVPVEVTLVTDVEACGCSHVAILVPDRISMLDSCLWVVSGWAHACCMFCSAAVACCPFCY
jgi:hypothetical protein